jgi:hypothetical protein
MQSDAAPVPGVPPDTRTLPLHPEIARRAYLLWLGYGRPRGRDVAIWLEAERQLLGADREVNQQSGGAVPAAPLADVFYPPEITERAPATRESSDLRA